MGVWWGVQCGAGVQVPSRFPHPQPEEWLKVAEVSEKGTPCKQRGNYPRPLASAPGSSAYLHPQPHTLAKLASVSLLQADRSSSCRACSVSSEGPWGCGEGSLGPEARYSSSPCGCGKTLLLGSSCVWLSNALKESGGIAGQPSPGTTPPSMILRVSHLAPLCRVLSWFPQPQKPPVLEFLAPGQAQV